MEWIQRAHMEGGGSAWSDVTLAGPFRPTGGLRSTSAGTWRFRSLFRHLGHCHRQGRFQETTRQILYGPICGSTS